MRNGLPCIDHLLLKLVEEGIVFLLLLRVALYLTGLVLVLHLNMKKNKDNSYG